MHTTVIPGLYGRIHRRPAPRHRLRDRLRARLLTTTLDRALAEGAPPDASPALGLRAQALSRPKVACELGTQLRGIVREAHEPPGPSTRITGCRERVLAAEDELRLLASRLQAAQPVAVTTIAKVRLLLTDGTGPLYRCASDTSLQAAIDDATRAIRTRAAASPGTAPGGRH